MPDTKISALTAGNPALGTDQIPVARSGANFQVTAASIAALSPAGTVTSVGLSGGGTGLSVSGTNPITSSGTLTLGGTLAAGSGGTGTSSTPSNGQLLIGTGSGYNVANLTAGTGIVITNAFGAITIAASGGGGTTIRVLTIATSSSGTFTSSLPSTSISKPLIGYTAGSPTNYGAFFFKSTSNSNFVTGPVSISTIGITDSTGTPTSYTSGPDFGSSPNTFSVYDDNVTCYALSIFSAGMQTLFTASKAAITSPSLAPVDASSSFSPTNPGISVSTSGSTYSNQSGQRGAVISKSGTDYILQFGSADTASTSATVTSLSLNINGAPSSYSNFSDFNVSFAFNSASGMFFMQMSVSNTTLRTLLNNSFL